MSGKIIIYITKNISLWKYIFFDYIAKITTNKIILFGILSVMGSYFFKLNMLFAFLFWFLGLIMFTLFGIIFIFSSFWFGNISPITTVIYFIITFSSGIVIPLDIYPLWLQKIIYILPFQYFLYVPTKIALGNIKITFHLFAIYLIWLLLLFILVKIIEIKGLQRYEQLGG